ncbi:MAG TPA: DUF502 domain-containing protein [Myxococcota bacterium]|nr:DUF502 domain-containing protein [Myxococcota bacterium]
MQRVVNLILENFLKGSLVLLPIVGSMYAAWWVLSTIDGLVGGVLPLHAPGLGLVLAVAMVTGTGALATNVIGRRLLRLVDELLERVPIVRLLYGAMRDLMAALVGEKKGFDRPAVVTLANGVRVLGFLTVDRFDDPALDGLVGVYLPQSYNFAGNLVLVPREAVTLLDRSGAEQLTFIASGGVASL